MKFNSNVDLLLEQLNSIKYTKREFYPRNFKLSDEFIKSFHRELRRLMKEEKITGKIALKKLCKSLIFHV